jgi:hypothetical protein
MSSAGMMLAMDTATSQEEVAVATRDMFFTGGANAYVH